MLVAIFEVMDKEPSLFARATLYILLGIIGYVMSRRTWWWGFFSLPVVAVFGWVDLHELVDPFVGPAIIREAGRIHVVGWYAVILAGFSLPIAGAILKKASKSPRRATGIAE